MRSRKRVLNALAALLLLALAACSSGMADVPRGGPQLPPNILNAGETPTPSPES